MANVSVRRDKRSIGMSSITSRPRHLFAAALALIFVVAFMPAGWLGWTGDVARVFGIVLNPFQQFGNSMAAFLQPERDIAIRRGSTGERQLLQDLQNFERLWQEARLHIEQLEEQLEELQRIPLTDERRAVVPLTAQITGRNPRGQETVVRLNRGSRSGVERDNVAVFGGVHLIGRVINTGTVQSEMRPITHPDTPPITVRILPIDQPQKPIDEGVRALLEPRGDGTFRCEIERLHTVNEGDLVRLAANDWPSAAQAMVVGTVTSVRQSDRNPLKKIVIVTPRFRTFELSFVNLLVDRRTRGGEEGGRG